MNITLATLAQATAQQVFDHVARHMLTQGREALNDLGDCQYRYHGLACAAGCLMAEAEYRPSMEGVEWSELVSSGTVPSAHKDLISLLQDIHDTTLLAAWKNNLRALAEQHQLSAAVLDEFPNWEAQFS